jgi:hypothetical protein
LRKLFASRLDVIQRLTGDHGGKLVPLSWWPQALAALDDERTREVVLWLKRQEGKSTFVAGSAASTILSKPNSYVLLVAGSEKQQKAIYTRKLRRPLERLMKTRGLDDLARFTDNGIEIPALNSALEVIAPNTATVPGRSVSELYLDECRSIPDEIFITLSPSVIATGGKLVLSSTAGKPAGFFYEICQHPSPETLLIHATQSENPHASESVLDYLKQRLGLLSPAALAREIENQFAEDGQPFLSPGLVDAALDPYLTESWSETAECVGFADLSRKRDLTSVVIVARHAPRRPEVADHLRVVSLQVWDPKRDPTGEVDFREVRAYLAALPRRFPHLRTLLIDGGAEGASVFPFCRAHSHLTTVVQEFTATQDSNRELWGALKARLEAGTLTIPRNDRLLQELKALRQESTRFGLSWRIVDSTKRLHRDLSLSLAGACFAASRVHEPGFTCDGQILGLTLQPSVHHTLTPGVLALWPEELAAAPRPRTMQQIKDLPVHLRSEAERQQLLEYQEEQRLAAERAVDPVVRAIQRDGYWWPSDQPAEPRRLG